jgi:hypothetical protein
MRASWRMSGTLQFGNWNDPTTGKWVCGWEREWRKRDERKTRDKTMVMRVCVSDHSSRGGAFTRASPSYCTRHTRPHTSHVWLVPSSPARWVESMWLTCSRMIKKEEEWGVRRQAVLCVRRCACDVRACVWWARHKLVARTVGSTHAKWHCQRKKCRSNTSASNHTPTHCGPRERHDPLSARIIKTVMLFFRACERLARPTHHTNTPTSHHSRALTSR